MVMQALREKDSSIPQSWPAIVAAAYATLGLTSLFSQRRWCLGTRRIACSGSSTLRLSFMEPWTCMEVRGMLEWI